MRRVLLRTMSYFSEFRTHWRPLTAAGLGLAVGLGMNSYTLNVFAPYMIADFGWSRAEYSLLGLLGLVSVASIPVAGRLADAFGARRIATIGVISLPLTFLAFSMMTGDIRQLFAIMFVQLILCATTTTAVYSRLVASAYVDAQGFALSVAISTPAILAAIGVPLLTYVVDTQGWRTGYQALAVIAAIGGGLAVLLAPSARRRKRDGAALLHASRSSLADYVRIARTPAFWLLFAAMLLCNIPAGFTGNQVNVVLIENGASTASAALMLSAYAISVIVGRFCCGLALDRFPARIVATVNMAIPAIGMFILWSSLDTPLALGAAIVLIGLAQGAEGDMLSFLVARHFGITMFGTVVGLLFTAVSGGAVVGSIVLSQMLSVSDVYAPFMFFCGVVTLIGSALFLLLRPDSPATDTAAGANTISVEA